MNGYVGSYAEGVFNNTWGHFAPYKNMSYRGKVRYTYTDHSQYGCQAIILTYDFGSLKGPYIHDALFRYVLDWNSKAHEVGSIYEVEMTFRNFRFYQKKPVKVLA